MSACIWVSDGIGIGLALNVCRDLHVLNLVDIGSIHSNAMPVYFCLSAS